MTWRQRMGRIAPAIVVVFLYGGLTLFRLGVPDLDSDEGRFGLAAANILSDVRQLAIVSMRPQGEPGTMPYMYPLTLATSMAVLGKTEFALRIVNVVGLLIGAAFLGAAVLVLTRDAQFAIVTFALFLINAWTVLYARIMVIEASLVVWGCVALFAAAKGRRDASFIWAAVSGVALGFAFLTKLWLVAPFVLAVAGLLAWRPAPGPAGRSIGLLFVCGAMFCLTAASHLLIVTVLVPEWSAHWVANYYGFTFQSRIAGAGYDPSMWYRPWWFYSAAAFKGTFFGLPFVLVGAVELVRARRTELLIVVGALLSPILLFSFFRVKQATYVYSAFPALAMLLALGVLTTLRRLPRAQLFASCLVSTVIALAFAAVGVLSVREWLAVVMLYALYGIGTALATTYPRWGQAVAAGAAVAFVAAMLLPAVIGIQKTLQHRTYYREVAQFFGPELQRWPKEDAAFVSPESPAMEFYTFHRGTYWETFYHQESEADFLQALHARSRLFYVVDPTGQLYGSRVPSGQLSALHQHAVDVTPAIELSTGQRLPVRIFATRKEGLR